MTITTTRLGKDTAETLTTYIEEKIKDQFADIIKWMFIFWIGQVAVTFGFILLFLKN